MDTVAQSQELCKVFYDRSVRQYIVRNGREIARFEQGKENLLKAQWAAIAHDGEAIEAVAREMLAEARADEGRIVRAARLAIAGHVSAHQRDRRDDCADWSRAIVRSGSDDERTYTVVHNLRWICECEDYERHDYGHRCKHTLAVEMLERKADREQVAILEAGLRKQADKRERRTVEIKSSDFKNCPQCREGQICRHCGCLACGNHWTKCTCDAAYASALASQQPKARIGGLPTEWQF